MATKINLKKLLFSGLIILSIIGFLAWTILFELGATYPNSKLDFSKSGIEFYQYSIVARFYLTTFDCPSDVVKWYITNFDYACDGACEKDITIFFGRTAFELYRIMKVSSGCRTIPTVVNIVTQLGIFELDK